MGLEARHAYRFGYLKSEHWAGLRARKLSEVGCRCFFCGLADEGNDVHHIHYCADLMKSETTHLRVLCRKHHERVHFIMDELLKQPKYAGKKGTDKDYQIFRMCCRIVEGDMILDGTIKGPIGRHGRESDTRDASEPSLHSEAKRTVESFRGWIAEASVNRKYWNWLSPTERDAYCNCQKSVKELLTAISQRY